MSNNKELPVLVRISGGIAMLICVACAAIILTAVPFKFGNGPVLLVPLILYAWYLHVKTKARQAADRMRDLLEKARGNSAKP